jgi:hypothetical protein
VATKAQPAPFNAFLEPEFQRIALGDTARLAFAVDSTATQFNGYGVTLGFDPVMAAFDTVTEGQLMKDACGNPNFFPSAVVTDSTVFVDHVILCAGVSVSGPGELSVFRFDPLAEGLSEVRILTDPDFLFYDAGIYVNPSHPTFPRQVFLENAWIAVGPNRSPTCDAGGPYTGESGVAITLDGSASGDDFRIDAYAWDFGDGNTASGSMPDHTWETGGIYTVTLCVTDNEGAASCCETTAEIEPVTGIADPPDRAPGRMPRLEQNRPNPFNPNTEIVFELPAAGPARIVISDVSGRHLWTRYWNQLPAGPHRVMWHAVRPSGKPLPSGLYVCELEASGARLTRKMLIVR